MNSRLTFAFSITLALAAACSSSTSPSAYCDSALAFASANASKMAACTGAAEMDAGPPAAVVTCTSVVTSASCTASDQSLLAMEGSNFPGETTCVGAIAPDTSDGGVDCLLGVRAAEAACQSPSQYVFDGGAMSLSSKCQDALATINAYP
jgi:hypothetical protein